jgi:drug/metabolite transporter (DMT)-like permease
MVPVFVLVFAHWLLPAEPMTLRKVAGVALGLAGVGVVFSDQLSSEGLLALWGSVALIVASLSLAWAQVAVKKHAGTLDPMTIAGWQMAIGTVPLLGLGLWLDGNPLEFAWTTRAVLSLLYLSFIGSAAAFFVLYWLFRRMEVTKVLSVAFANPLVAVLLGWLVAGEVLSWRAVVGGLGILGGLALVLRAAPARKRARSRDPAPVTVQSE